MKDLYVVSIDSRGKSSSDISGYQEHMATTDYFRKNIARHPDVICYPCKIARQCGMDLKIYFHPLGDVNSCDESHISAKTRLNQSAMLLTLNPNTGLCDHEVRGVAYATLNDGKAPLSFHQVWGIQELINDAYNMFESNPENPNLARKELMKNCVLYRYKEWGPLSIYQLRKKSRASNHTKLWTDFDDGTSGKNREPFKNLQVR